MINAVTQTVCVAMRREVWGGGHAPGLRLRQGAGGDRACMCWAARAALGGPWDEMLEYEAEQM